MGLGKTKHSALKIGIVGAGFSGTALAFALYRLSPFPIDIILFEKSGRFAKGEAYNTPYDFHLLNVRAQDMSAIETDPQHFVNWVLQNPHAQSFVNKDIPIAKQFLPRALYGQYLSALLSEMQSQQQTMKLTLQPAEVVAARIEKNQVKLSLQDQQEVMVDKVVLAIGNNPACAFPFPVENTKAITSAWYYEAPKQIAAQESVLIVGTGLSMIDTVLTLHHQQHQGKIYAISRRGLLPLPHTDQHLSLQLAEETFPTQLRQLTRYLREQAHMLENNQSDWRAIMQAIRPYLPSLWKKLNLRDKKSFLRHAVSYWNIHRHRVHDEIAALLASLQKTGQLIMLSGRVLSVKNNAAQIKLRRQATKNINVDWLINCLGPELTMKSEHQLLMQSLVDQDHVRFDELNLGFDITDDGAIYEKTGEKGFFYTLGPPAKGVAWESTAVPEIRKQCFNLAMHLLSQKEKENCDGIVTDKIQ